MLHISIHNRVPLLRVAFRPKLRDCFRPHLEMSLPRPHCQDLDEPSTFHTWTVTTDF